MSNGDLKQAKDGLKEYINVCANLFEAFYHLQHAISNRDNLSRFHLYSIFAISSKQTFILDCYNYIPTISVLMSTWNKFIL